VAADRFSTAARLKVLGHQAQARVYRATGLGPDGRRVPRRSRLTGRAALLALTVCVLVVALAYPTRQYIAQRSQIAEQRRTAQQARERVQQLREEEARWSDPEYVRTQARARLHYVMPGETGYTVPGAQASVAGGDRAGVGTSPNRPWYDNLWDSMNSADARH
jgi:cell division protein FtsB